MERWCAWDFEQELLRFLRSRCGGLCSGTGTGIYYDPFFKGGHEVVLVLKRVIRLAKASTCQMPDYDGSYVGEIVRVLAVRAAPLRLIISEVECARSLLSTWGINLGSAECGQTWRLGWQFCHLDWELIMVRWSVLCDDFHEKKWYDAVKIRSNYTQVHTVLT